MRIFRKTKIVVRTHKRARRYNDFDVALEEHSEEALIVGLIGGGKAK